MDCPVCTAALHKYRQHVLTPYPPKVEKQLLEEWHKAGHPDLNKQP